MGQVVWLFADFRRSVLSRHLFEGDLNFFASRQVIERMSHHLEGSSE